MIHSRDHHQPQVRGRALLLSAAAVAAGCACLVAARTTALTAYATAPRTFTELLVLTCTALALAAALWLCAVVAANAIPLALRGPEGAPAARSPQRSASRIALLVATACGIGFAGPAMAQEAGHPLHGLPLPSRPTIATATGPVEPVAAHHRVRPGESLWSIAAAELGPGASFAVVDARWRAVYAANRERIGPDPDVLHVGTVLRLPQP